MSTRPRGAPFADGFWNSPFNPADTTPALSTKTQVWWPHGALHLYRLPDGSTIKVTYQHGTNLLSLLQYAQPGADLPLFVSEGTPSEKLAAIRRSDYLSTAYNQLALSSGGIVIYGQRLAQPDEHFVAAINRDPERPIAYGIYADTQPQADAEVARIKQLFPQATLRFFDSRTHPLA